MARLTGVSERLGAALSDRYTIERELGQGGMATVYLAHDIKHRRKVAIKVLRPDLAAALGPDRFMQEIEIAARLQHPHILGVHDSGQADGFLYYVMPYVEGESLRERLTRQGELPVHEAVRLLAEVADALAHAHARGVVHRDIKPENVMLSGRHALVMDFGVAKAVNDASGQNRLTTLGVALGTPAYMAPEQASADPHLDHRVDIYALGVLGYELLAGRPPFTGASPQQVLAAHVTQTPEPVSIHRRALSPALSSVIMKALEKRPADRWQSAEEMLAHLEPLATPSGGMTPAGTVPVAAIEPRVRSIFRPKAWAVGVTAIAALAAVVFWVTRARSGGADAATLKSVAVLPFENVGGDSGNSAFTDGIQSEILTDLTRIAELQVTSRNSVQEYRGSRKPVKQIGAELGVGTLLQGQVQRAGNQVHVTVQLVNAARDRQIWAESYDRELSLQNIFAIQGDIAGNVAQALRASFTAAETAATETPPTHSLDALDWYHRGIGLFATRGGATHEAAITRAFQQAVLLDSNFAGAWAGLAAALSWERHGGSVGDTLSARKALDRATALAPGSAETEIAHAYYDYYAREDYDAALSHFRSVVRSRPNDVEAIAGIGFVARRQRRWDEALAALEKAVTLDPRSVGTLTALGVTYLSLRQYQKAESLLRRAVSAFPDDEGAMVSLLTTLVAGPGDTASVRAVVDATPRSLPEPIRQGIVAALARYARHFDESNAVFSHLVQNTPLDLPAQLIGMAVNDLAAGVVVRARARADSVLKLLDPLIIGATGAEAAGTRANTYTYRGLANALLGRSAEAVRDGEMAVRLNPVSHDALGGPTSIDGLITIHLILGHREEAIRLIIQEAHEAFQVASLISTSPGMIRLDPIFDIVRDDPRIQALLKNDAAWVVK